MTKIDGHPIGKMSVFDASNQILGPVGTKVVLTIQRGNQSQFFKLTRANIALYPVTYKRKQA
ncbi:hypothetical protein [Aetokthonos hydrillicola]|uniref:hypothetical protein n=1 Tax=Aetokthonos hydrillicola TaxID=1550245 RepID=UPI003BB4A34C